jgi:hypothetical protein
MLVDIKFNHKEQSCSLEFSFLNLINDMAIKEALAILTIISSDFYLDPELDVDDINEFISQGKEKSKSALLFEVSEDGLELEFK